MRGKAFGFAARCAVRWARWARLSIGPKPPPVIPAAYWAGVRDTLEALALAERERLVRSYRHGDNAERADAQLEWDAIREAIGRARRDVDALTTTGVLRDAGRVPMLLAELDYVRGEGRPAGDEFGPRLRGQGVRLRPVTGSRGQGPGQGVDASPGREAAGPANQPTRASQSTDLKSDSGKLVTCASCGKPVNCDRNHEYEDDPPEQHWYAHLPRPGRDENRKTLLADDEQGDEEV
jgi:hypothetical protein